MKKFLLLFLVFFAGSLVSCSSDKKSDSSSIPAAVQTSYATTTGAVDVLLAKINAAMPSFPGSMQPSSSLGKVLKLSKTKLGAPNYSSTSGSYTDTNGYFSATWSYDNTTSGSGSYTYTLNIIKDYTVTLDDGTSFTFKAGGTDTQTYASTYSTSGNIETYTDKYVDTANFPYSYAGASHTFGWSINITDAGTYNSSTYVASGTETMSGTLTYDGTSYTFSESSKYSY